MPPRAPSCRPIELIAGPTAKELDAPAVLPVRLQDAAGGLLLRLRDLRQHQRLLVG